MLQKSTQRLISLKRVPLWRPFALRFINCNSCGVKLQDKKADEKGYYIYPKLETKQESIQDIKYLLFSQDIHSFHEAQMEDETNLVDKDSDVKHNLLICKRCNDLLYQNKYNINDFKSVSLPTILKDIPEQSRIAIMSPLSEFPFHITKDLLLSKDYKPILVFTKSDQIISAKYLLHKILPTFFDNFFKANFDGKDTFPIIAVSTVKKWNIATLLSRFGKKTYLLGNANVGKSTLINSLLEEYLGVKMGIDQKGEAKLPKNIEPVTSTNVTSFVKSQAAGVSYVPNMTQSIQPYQIDNKIIFDLPGYSDATANSMTRLETMINKNWLQRIRKTELHNHKRVKVKPYSSFRGTEKGAVYTVGGIFYLKPPPNTINKITKYIPGESKNFTRIDRAFQVFKECVENNDNNRHPLNKYCGILPKLANKDEFVRHIIPPFQGSIEIVLKDIGYILLRPTGAFRFNGLYEIWVPKGIEVCVREPLESIMKLARENYIETKSSKSVFPYNRPLVSSTYPMPFEEEEPLLKMKERYLELTSHDLMNQRHINDDPLQLVSKLHANPPNLYWYYKW